MQDTMHLFIMLLISLLLATGSASDVSSIAAVDDGHVAAARLPIEDVPVRRSLATELLRRGEIAGRRGGGKAKEPPVLVEEPFVAAAAAGRSSLADGLSCPADPLRAPRVVLLFTGHLRGTCPLTLNQPP
jgi:hypothetical protein